MEKLLAEILKAQDNLSDISFSFNKKEFIFYFRYLTLLENVRIEQMCVKRREEILEDGTLKVTWDKQEHLMPIHTILEKALDKEGKRLFSHTNPKHFELVSKLPAELAKYVAYEMSLDIMGNLKGDSNG